MSRKVSNLRMWTNWVDFFQAKLTLSSYFLVIMYLAELVQEVRFGRLAFVFTFGQFLFCKSDLVIKGLDKIKLL